MPSGALTVERFELLTVKATERTTWRFVRLHSQGGQTGLGEASLGRTAELPELDQAFAFAEGRPADNIHGYRARGREWARTNGLRAATAFSSIEQALWDLLGRSLGIPTWRLFGGRLREDIEVYANINRATRDRTPDGFATNARRATDDGYRTIKAAPFDGFPALDADAPTIEEATRLGVACVAAMRAAVSSDVKILIDCHSFFDLELAVEVARRLEPYDLTWYEEPVAPTRVGDTATIHNRVRQPIAGGEMLFGMEGFAPLLAQGAVDIIMPDVKHCGGLEEMRDIAALARMSGVEVSPHNPSGPVATAASLACCATIPNASLLEVQWGEVDWRGRLLTPPELVEGGRIRIPDGPGLGIELDEGELARHSRGLR